MNIQKWDFETKEYQEHTVPKEWKVLSYSQDMDEEINCTGCGCKTTVGVCYTSRQFHTSVGFGYAVCEKCYKKEWEEDRKFN